MECFPAVSVHAANALASAAPAKGSCRRCETDPLPPGGLAALEHCRLRSVLRTAFHGSCYGESWFVAATWQITIVAGVLLTPLFGSRIPVKNLLFSAVILAGIFMLQLPHLESMESSGSLKALALILIAGVCYPLGNRKMMAHCPAGFSTTQRVFGMTLCSMPFWLLCSVYALFTHGLPSFGQVVQSVSVALFSGVVATLLFFEATNLVRHNPKQLAVIEATQAGEVLFTLLGGILFLHDSLPTKAGFLGIGIVVLGMLLNSLSG